jgi:hypothetical protein
MDNSLTWSPVYRVIEDRLKTKDDLSLLIVSFIKIEALTQLLWVADQCKNLKVIVRWRIQDVVSGASDLEIFPFLRDKKIPLYFNEKIHLKLYIFESNVAFNTSGNLTLKGLGYSANGNVEVGSMVTLTEADWQAIYELTEQSTPVDEAIYQQMMETVKNVPKQAMPVSLPPWPAFPRKTFTIQAFPGTEDPETLIKYYLSTARGAYSGEDQQRAIHDLVTLKMPQGLDQAAALKHAQETFLQTPFVAAFVDELKIRKSMSFGAVSDWVHTKCEDVPVPYRWEIKDSVRRLYNWLAAANPSITWDRPRYSMVIYWKS